MGIAIQCARVPAARLFDFAALSRDVAKVAENDHVLRVQGERQLENFARLVNPVSVVKCLAVHNVTAHVGGLLGEVRAANRYRLLGVTGLAVFVGERGKIAPRILVEFLPQLFDPR